MNNMATFDASPCYSATINDIHLDLIKKEYLPKTVNADELKMTRKYGTAIVIGLYDMT